MPRRGSVEPGVDLQPDQVRVRPHDDQSLRGKERGGGVGQLVPPALAPARLFHREDVHAESEGEASDSSAPAEDPGQGSKKDDPRPSKPTEKTEPAEPPEPTWADKWWVWVLAGLGLALLIGILHLTSPGAGN